MGTRHMSNRYINSQKNQYNQSLISSDSRFIYSCICTCILLMTLFCIGCNKQPIRLQCKPHIKLKKLKKNKKYTHYVQNISSIHTHSFKVAKYIEQRLNQFNEDIKYEVERKKVKKKKSKKKIKVVFKDTFNESDEDKKAALQKIFEGCSIVVIEDSSPPHSTPSKNTIVKSKTKNTQAKPIRKVKPKPRREDKCYFISQKSTLSCNHQGIRNTILDALLKRSSISSSDIEVFIQNGVASKIRYGNIKKKCGRLASSKFSLKVKRKLSVKKICRSMQCPTEPISKVSAEILLDVSSCHKAWCTYVVENIMNRKDQKEFCESDTSSKYKGVMSCKQFCKTSK